MKHGFGCVKDENGLFPFQGKPPFFYKWLRDERGNVKPWAGMHGGNKKRAIHEEMARISLREKIANTRDGFV